MLLVLEPKQKKAHKGQWNIQKRWNLLQKTYNNGGSQGSDSLESSQSSIPVGIMTDQDNL